VDGVYSVEYAVRLNGTMEACEWFQKQDAKIQAKFDHLFRVVAAGHRIHNEQQFRKLSDDIWEFKRDSHRLFTFQDGSSWFLTHYYKKGGQKCPKRQIKHAEIIRIECLQILRDEAEGEDNGNT
jgi:phage-related protein